MRPADRFGRLPGTNPPVGLSRRQPLDVLADAAYSSPMDDTPHLSNAPAGWAEALDESLVEVAAAVPTVDGTALIRELYASVEKLEAEQQSRKATRRR